MTHGIVSDIDDTVITTMLPRPMIAACNTFVRRGKAPHAVAGMAPMYRRSSSAHPGCADRLRLDRGVEHRADPQPLPRRERLPPRAAPLTDWGPTNTGWFRSGQAHKRAASTGWPATSPTSGGCSSATTASTTPRSTPTSSEARPEHVDAVCIRHLSPTEQVLSHPMGRLDS